jgi:hypothetical protein
MSRRPRLQLAAIIVSVAAYAALSHYSNTVARTHDLAVGLTLAPVLTVGLLLTWRWTPAWVALPAAAAAAAAAVLLRHYWPVLEEFSPGLSAARRRILQPDGGQFRPFPAGGSCRAMHAARRQGAWTPHAAGGALHAPRHGCMGNVLRRDHWSHVEHVRVRAAAHMVAIRQFLRAAADRTHVRG